MESPAHPYLASEVYEINTNIMLGSVIKSYAQLCNVLNKSMPVVLVLVALCNVCVESFTVKQSQIKFHRDGVSYLSFNY